MRPIGRKFLALLWLSACAHAAPVALPLAYPKAAAVAARRGAETPEASSTVASPGPSSELTKTAPATFGSAPFASPGRVWIEQASPDGRWVALCRALAKGASGAPTSAAATLGRVLITPGAERPIDAWLRATNDGHFAAFLQNGRLFLWNSQAQSTIDLSALGADSRLSAESYAEVRVLDFDAQGTHLLYLRRAPHGSRLVVRSLRDDSEQELDPGPGEVWRARFDPGGAFIVLQSIRVDSNNNGRLDFPAPLSSGPRECGDNLRHYRVWEARGDRPETVLLPLSGEAAIHEPELVMPVIDSLLLRDEDGALLLARGQHQRELEDAACKGRIVHADAARDFFIVGCTRKKKSGRMSLELVTRAARLPLDLELSRVEFDNEMSDSPRLVALYPGADSLIFDGDRLELIPLQPADSVLATQGGRALIRRADELVVYDADTRRETALIGQVDKFPDIFRTPPFVFISPLLVDLSAGTVVGQTHERPLALSQDGQLLIGTEATDAPDSTAAPLHWLTLGVP